MGMHCQIPAYNINLCAILETSAASAPTARDQQTAASAWSTPENEHLQTNGTVAKMLLLWRNPGMLPRARVGQSLLLH